jgi:hypothetical protein
MGYGRHVDRVILLGNWFDKVTNKRVLKKEGRAIVKSPGPFPLPDCLIGIAGR